MRRIADLEALHALYGMPKPASTRKVAARLTDSYARWIAAARFCILSTVGEEGTDASPRGDDGPVVAVLDPGRLALPDWRGNDRLDSLRNVVRDSRVSLLFMVPGSSNVVRVNGQGWITDDADLRARFARDGALPRSVLIVDIGEVYFQCARAILRARLWTAGDESANLPTAGDMLASASGGDEGGPDYDRTWPARAARTLW
ncbi:pyridoxamine 5'-phosphate oxidase family protein [Rhodobacteraceae bacterium CCMM004]|nr:pyridoxamine 5'-phosphate oxidase family protein [Rhodobacteraceae bacterium CCMM004]